MTQYKYQDFLVLYDVFDQGRLRRVRKLVYSYATGGQKSALETPLDRQMTKALISEIEPLLDDEDKVNIVRVSPRCILLGKATQVDIEQNGIIIT